MAHECVYIFQLHLWEDRVIDNFVEYESVYEKQQK